jgi:hypothetical protein
VAGVLDQAFREGAVGAAEEGFEEEKSVMLHSLLSTG